MLRLLALVLLLAGEASAGAWPRESHRGFVALSYRWLDGTVPDTARQQLSFYGEFGVNGRLKLGLDMGVSAAGLDKAILFGTTQIFPAQWRTRLAAGFGVGTVGGRLALRPSLAIGHGFTLAGRPAWAEAAAAIEYTPETLTFGQKLDLTFGLAVTPRTRVYAQLFASRTNYGPVTLRSELSAAIRLFGDTSLDLGISRGISPHRDNRLKLGLWTEF